ncbi:hypothetical protein [uncultured Shewanella sp.]|uniref:hypothetical protein n=1 Tax=uncultured Shewanella sp. TaxID=173975 RepID=UPI00261F421B|nr:hypothetical protein [uncultured Shewanella sp.]
MLAEIILIKVISTLLVVMGLAFIAENSSTRIAGILSGFPSGMAIVIFFLGFDNGTQFAVSSVDHTILGSLSAIVFAYIYYRVALVCQETRIWLPLLAALMAFLVSGNILIDMDLSILMQLMLAVIAIVIAARLFKSVGDYGIKDKVALTHKVLFYRSLVAACIVLFITGVAELIGVKWAGVLSGFPVTFAPFLLVIHSTYGNRVAFTLLKNYVFGIGASISYAVAVLLFYPLLGIYLGTLASLLAASLYLAVYVFLYQYWKRR